MVDHPQSKRHSPPPASPIEAPAPAPPPAPGEGPQPRQHPGIVQTNTFPRGKDRARVKIDQVRNNFTPVINAVAIAAPVVGARCEYQIFKRTWA